MMIGFAAGGGADTQARLIAEEIEARKGWKTLADVTAAIKKAEKVSFGAMSQKLADGAYLVGKAHGVQYNIVELKGGKAVLDAITAGDIDIGWVAGPQGRGVAAGDLVNLASGEAKRLSMSSKTRLKAAMK